MNPLCQIQIYNTVCFFYISSLHRTTIGSGVHSWPAASLLSISWSMPFITSSLNCKSPDWPAPSYTLVTPWSWLLSFSYSLVGIKKIIIIREGWCISHSGSLWLLPFSWTWLQSWWRLKVCWNVLSLMGRNLAVSWCLTVSLLIALVWSPQAPEKDSSLFSWEMLHQLLIKCLCRVCSRDLSSKMGSSMATHIIM